MCHAKKSEYLFFGWQKSLNIFFFGWQKNRSKGILILTGTLPLRHRLLTNAPKMAPGATVITSIRVNGTDSIRIREKTVTSEVPCKPEVVSGELSFVTDPAFDNDGGRIYIGMNGNFVCIDGVARKLSQTEASSIIAGMATETRTIDDGVRFDPYARKAKRKSSPATRSDVRRLDFAAEHDLSEYRFKVDSVHATGGSELSVEGNIFAAHLSVHSSGQANVTCRGEPFEFVECHASGQSTLNMRIRCDMFDVHASGQANVEGFTASRSCEINASGQSGVNGHMSRDAKLTKNTSGQASVSVSVIVNS